jgi:hypothetical protein
MTHEAMLYTWRLVQCFQGSFERYKTWDSRIMTEEQKYSAQLKQNKIDASKCWVR